MRLTELRIDDLRLFRHLELSIPAGWSVFAGPNGAGKTSLLEAVFLLSHGRSFRSGAREALTRTGSDGFAVFGRVQRGAGAVHGLGLARVRGRLEARIDGNPIGLADLLQRSAVVCFEPGSHELIAGGSEERRRFLDWGTFHVEPGFLDLWRRYQRALRQRNALLRKDADLQAFEPWDRELAQAGERLTGFRRRYIGQLQPILLGLSARLLPELGEADMVFNPGWDASLALDAALAAGTPRDRERGHTGRGPHRADWSLVFAAAPRREQLSRGQEKLCALACLLAQAQLYARQHEDWPVLCLDDLASELDEAHLRLVLGLLAGTGAQVLLAGTSIPAALAEMAMPLALFHVEQGQVHPLL